MQKRKGFTLVELVIVIAVVAILAGVLIGTFASVINKANESAKLQEMKAVEHEQKADDLLKKIENSNWYGWEDFEASIVEKMTQVFKANPQSTTISTDDIKVAVKSALKEYTESSTSQNTSLTEEQVKVIIEDAIGKISFNGVTEAQVRAIVSAATSSITATQLSVGQVKSIVNAAAEKGLTATDVAAVIANAGLATDATYQQILAAVQSASASALKPEDVSNAIIDLLPVTYKVASATDLANALSKVNSFSTLNFTADYGTEQDPVTITLPATDNRTLTIIGIKLNNLKINAPVATIYLVTDAGTVLVESVADNSFHVKSTVNKLTVNKGRIVVEENAKVSTLEAAPVANVVVAVKVEQNAEVTTLDFALSNAGVGINNKIKLENEGKVGGTEVTLPTGTITTEFVFANGSTASGASAKSVADAITVANVKVTDETAKVNYTSASGSTEAVTEPVYTEVTLTGLGTDENPYLIRTVDELLMVADKVNNGTEGYVDGYYKLKASLDISQITWAPIGNSKDNPFKGTFDGDNNTIVGLNNRASYVYTGVQTANHSTTWIIGDIYGFIGVAQGDVTIKNVSFSGVDINSTTSKVVGVALGDMADQQDARVTIDHVNTQGTIVGKDKCSGLVGYTSSGNGVTHTLTIKDCNVNASVYAAQYRAGGLIGMIGYRCATTITNTSYTGSVGAKGLSDGQKCVGVITGYKGGSLTLSVSGLTIGEGTTVEQAKTQGNNVVYLSSSIKVGHVIVSYNDVIVIGNHEKDNVSENVGATLPNITLTQLNFNVDNNGVISY